MPRTRRSRGERLDLVGEVEEILSGENGAMPGIPLYWDVFANLESLAVEDTFTIDPLGQNRPRRGRAALTASAVQTSYEGRTGAA